MRRWAWVAVVFLAGCYESRAEPRDGAAAVGDAAVEPRPLPPPPPTRDLDLLFVVDDSGSMSEEQASLSAAISPMVGMLTTGDLDGDGAADFTPIESMQIGVVTTDMGVGGNIVPTCADADFGDDGVLRTQGRTDITGCMATYPTFLAFGGLGDPEAFANDVSCVATVGNAGCGFEQQLEAALKAISPSAPTTWTAPDFVAPRFFRNTFGHADGANAGFVRDDSILAVVVVTDEEDCSAADPELFNPASPTYGVTDLNLRCWAHADMALYPLSRYVDGLLQLRRHPSRLVYAVIAGVPTDLATSSGGTTQWDLLVGPRDGTRDERMVEQVDPTMPTRRMPSCNVPGRGIAFPPVRMVRVGRELESRGARVTIQSICQESFTSVVTEIVALTAD